MLFAMLCSVRSPLLSLVVLALLCAEGRTGAARAAEQQTPIVDTICPLMEQEAQRHGLSPFFFVRLIWRESRFRTDAVSHKGAQGIAQFMPATAKERGLKNPFDPALAIPHSARLLADLKREFGNHGLAAAAYNAGSERIRGWLEGKRTLPAETAAYVRFITGLPAEDWKQRDTTLPEEIESKSVSLQDSCRKLAPNVVRVVMPKTRPAAKPIRRPWGVQLAANFSQAKVAGVFDDLKRRHAKLLANTEPMFVSEKMLSRGRQAMVTLRVGADSREEAQKLCERLRADGGTCTVQKN